ncbi:MAG: hypothetical protein NXH91_07545 [Phyllobacteriaceae bacterium]|jgi:hypothetical protein|nr:hypothetical protein [Phyllobacteriaceae bacterium]
MAKKEIRAAKLIGAKRYAKLKERYDEFVGQAIVDKLVEPDMLSSFPPLGLHAKGPDYEQDGGDYEQATGGEHTQTGGGSYKQSVPETLMSR